MDKFRESSELPVKISISRADVSREKGFYLHYPPFSDGRVVEIAFTVYLSAIIGVLGCVGNIVNIVIFFKQGFNTSINISLFVRAISDLGAIVPLLWRGIYINPLYQHSITEMDLMQLHYKSTGWPHRCFVRITSWITALITFERCVCIAMPLKTKEIFTPKKAFFANVALLFLTTVTVAPLLFAFDLKESFSYHRNETVFQFIYSTNGIQLENVLFVISFIDQFVSIIIVIVCTGILIYNLLAVSQWRLTTTVVSHSRFANSLPPRDKRVVKMVTFISCTFIVSILPGTTNAAVMILFPIDYRIMGTYNTFQISWAVIVFLETINSSISFLVYYSMGSRFRATFNNLFLPTARDKHCQYRV